MSHMIITLQYGDFPVFFQENAFINATHIAKRFNKQAHDYLNHEHTRCFLENLKRYALKDGHQLIIEKKESETHELGMWLHPYLVVDFARWLAADFAVWCEKQIELMLHTTKGNLMRPQEKCTADERSPASIRLKPPVIEHAVPDGMVVIAAKRYQQLQKIAGLTTFDHIKEMVEENGGKVLLKSEFDKIKDLLNM